MELVNGFYVQRYTDVFNDAIVYKFALPNGSVIADILLPKDGAGVADVEAITAITKALGKRIGLNSTAKVLTEQAACRAVHNEPPCFFACIRFSA